jgi:hypothetical protein
MGKWFSICSGVNDSTHAPCHEPRQDCISSSSVRLVHTTCVATTTSDEPLYSTSGTESRCV